MARIDKSRFRTGVALGNLGLEVGLEGYSVIDYDRRAMRAALVRGAADVRKEARRIVSRRAISSPGEMPGQQSGRLKRSIGIVSKGSKGGWVKIGPRTIQNSVFYPAFLFYGTRVLNKAGAGIDKNKWRKRTRNFSQETINRVSDQRMKPRGNFMAAALKNKRDVVRGAIRAALKQALVPR